MPIIQIVHETLVDIKEGKGSKVQGKSTSGGKNNLFQQHSFFFIKYFVIRYKYQGSFKSKQGYFFVGTKWKMSMFDRTDAMGMLC